MSEPIASSNGQQLEPIEGSCKPFYRLTLIVLSVLFLVSAILCFAKVGALSQLGNVGGGVGLGLSAILFALSFLCRVKEDEKAKEKPDDFKNFANIVKANLLSNLPVTPVRKMLIKFQHRAIGSSNMIHPLVDENQLSLEKIERHLNFLFGQVNNTKADSIKLTYLILIEDMDGLYYLLKSNSQIVLTSEGTIDPLYSLYKESPNCYSKNKSLSNILQYAKIEGLSMTEEEVRQKLNIPK